MWFKKNKVWAEVDEQGQAVVENGRIRIKYQLDQPHEYRVHPRHVSELDSQPPGKEPEKENPGKKEPEKEVPGEKQGVIIYTDGASSGNPGPAGIGAVLRYGGRKKEISRYIGCATNNIAELEAVRAALSALKRKDLPVRLHTDSSYVHGLLVHGWRARKNPELVKQVRDLVAGFRDIQIIKVSGHKGVADNERADQLATSAISRHRGDG